ncbi:hypothetical protein FACS1894187_10520 [Synergistales bacterium]|nr:hypothetical protein FACS1894187_10520 [Synergistales bacterium]
MGTRYYYKDSVIGVVKDRRPNIWWHIAYISNGKRIISKSLKMSSKELVMQERLDEWAAEKGLEAVEEPKTGPKTEPEIEIEGKTPGKRVPVGALAEGQKYFLFRSYKDKGEYWIWSEYKGFKNGTYFFRILTGMGYVEKQYTPDALTHYEIREVVGA